MTGYNNMNRVFQDSCSLLRKFLQPINWRWQIKRLYSYFNDLTFKNWFLSKINRIFGITVKSYLWKYSFYPKIFSIKIWPVGDHREKLNKKKLRGSTAEFWRKIFLDKNYIFRGSFLRWSRISCLFWIKINFWKSNRWNTNTFFTKMSTIDSSDSKSVPTDSDSDSSQFQPIPIPRIGIGWNRIWCTPSSQPLRNPFHFP